ncbi:hypothetical protein ACO0QE_003773 [Hanseniaspora vineae]
MAKLESMWASSSEDEDTDNKPQQFVQKHTQKNQKKNSFSNRKTSGSWQKNAQNTPKLRTNSKGSTHRPDRFSGHKKDNKKASNFSNKNVKQNPLAAAMGLNLTDLKSKRGDSSDSSEYETTDDEGDTVDLKKSSSQNPLAARLGISLDADSTLRAGSKSNNGKNKEEQPAFSNGSVTSAKSTSQMSKMDILKKKIEEQKKILAKTHEKKKIMDSIDMLTKDLNWDAEEIDISKIKI